MCHSTRWPSGTVAMKWPPGSAHIHSTWKTGVGVHGMQQHTVCMQDSKEPIRCMRNAASLLPPRLHSLPLSSADELAPSSNTHFYALCPPLSQQSIPTYNTMSTTMTMMLMSTCSSRTHPA